MGRLEEVCNGEKSLTPRETESSQCAYAVTVTVTGSSSPYQDSLLMATMLIHVNQQPPSSIAVYY